ncbi:MAG TPA: hypothetical protein DEQ65_01765 [Ruminococcaceae bacterium]|nr:hypothetical protein [Oscillospiraceae bacterium]
MKIKTKKIIIYTFCLGLILCTVILSVAAAVSSYSYDINNSVDVFGGFGAAFYLMLGAFFVLYETDFFCTVHYFIFKPKTRLKTALNILSNLSLLLLFIYGYLIEVYMELRKYESPLLAVALFLAYMILRTAYIAACCYQKNTEKQE